VSVEAICWALNPAPVPAGRGGQPSTACKVVLVGLASHAGPDGTGAFPAVATLVRYTGLSERTVRTWLDRLDAAGIIRWCDPEIVAARITRAGRRPQGWDLDLSLIRDDLTEAGLAALEHRFPAWPPGPRWPRARTLAAQLTGGNHRTPPEPRITGLTGCSPCPPHPERGATSAPAGCNRRGPGVQQWHPNRPENHPGNRPPPARAGARRGPQRLRRRRRAGRGVLRGARPGLAADTGPAGQADPGRAGGSG
jgi:hypothetical protein